MIKTIVLTLVLRELSGVLVKWWLSKREQIRAGLKDIDNQIEAKTGRDLPDELQERYERMVDSAIAYADRFAGDGAFWRNVIRAVMNKDTSKVTVLLDEIRNIDWKKYLYDQLSDELKEVVNTEKKAVAASIVMAHTAKAEAVKTGNMNAAIDAAAKADKSERLRQAEPVNETVIERLIRESKERQDKLRANMH